VGAAWCALETGIAYHRFRIERWEKLAKKK
jgi:hypothetical protein